MPTKYDIQGCIQIVEELVSVEDLSIMQAEELLYLLDMLSQLHHWLDDQDVPRLNRNGLDLTLNGRVAYLVGTQRLIDFEQYVVANAVISAQTNNQIPMF